MHRELSECQSQRTAAPVITIDNCVAGENTTDGSVVDVQGNQGLCREAANFGTGFIDEQNHPVLFRQVYFKSSSNHVFIMAIHQSEHGVAIGRGQLGRTQNSSGECHAMYVTDSLTQDKRCGH